MALTRAQGAAIAASAGVVTLLLLAGTRAPWHRTPTPVRGDASPRLVVEVRDAGASEREVVLRGAADDARLFAFDARGTLVAPPRRLVPTAARAWTTRVPEEALALRCGPLDGVVVAGRSEVLDALEEALAREASAAGATARDRVAAEADARGADAVNVSLAPASTSVPFDDDAHVRAEQALADGAAEHALAIVTPMCAGASGAPRLRASAVAAEAWWALGYVDRAARVAGAALDDAREGDAATVARLLLVELRATRAPRDGGVPLPETRAALTGGAGAEARFALAREVVTAASDRGVAIESTALDAARRVVASVDDAPLLLTDAVGDVCRAASLLARGGDSARGRRALDVASSLAAAANHPNDLAACAVARGDVALGEGRDAAAGASYAAAASALGDRALPWMGRTVARRIALVAEAQRNDAAAFAAFARAVAYDDVLLARAEAPDARAAAVAMLRDDARAALRAGLAAHAVAEALALVEHAKAADRAVRFDDAASLACVMTTRMSDEGAQTRLMRTLGPDDAALLYAWSTPSRGSPTLAVGVVTRESVEATAVDVPRTLAADLAALRRALAAGDEGAAHAYGERLYASLLAPIAARVETKARLLVSGDEGLDDVPWEALFDGEHAVVERFAFARVRPLACADRDRAADDGGAASERPFRWVTFGADRAPSRDDASIVSLAPSTAAAAFAGALGGARGLVYVGPFRVDRRAPMRSRFEVAPSEGDDAFVTLGRIAAEGRVPPLAVLAPTPDIDVVDAGAPAIAAEALLAAGARYVLVARPWAPDEARRAFLAVLRESSGEADVVRTVAKVQAALAQRGGAGLRAAASFDLDVR